MAVANLLLRLLPEPGRQQVGMILVKYLAQGRRGEQEGAELFGENVVLGDRVPDFARHLRLEVRCWRDLAEIAVGHVFDFVVVIEHDAPIARDAEIFPQHVAGEDIGLCHFADGATVFPDCMLNALDVVAALHAVEVDVQRFHAALDVEVLDDQLLTIDLEARRRQRPQFFQYLVGKPVERKQDVGEFQCVGQAADAVDLLDHHEFFLDRGAIHVLRSAEDVLDDLEDGHLLSKGFDAIGLTGSDRNLFLAVPENIKLGLVGIPKINQSSTWILELINQKVIPVFSSVCRNEEGHLMNVNADIFSNSLAIELKADSVFFNSDIDGVIINKEVKHQMTESNINESIQSGQVYGGMIPKLNSAVELVKKGIGQVWIGSSNPDDLLDLLTEKQHKGTLIIPEINPEGVIA